jgi:heptosyltransferase I
MRVLLIKTSSLGDVIHSLPAVTDAQKALPDIKFDWVVEEGLVEIPAWHPAVREVIPVAIRRWRKAWIKSLLSDEFRTFKQRVKQPYDLVLDAQGLLKSAWLAWMSRSPRYGLDKHSAREPLAASFYQEKIFVAKGDHAIDRVRQLFAKTLGYECPPLESIDFGLQSMRPAKPEKAIVFLHGTTWVTKHWPEKYWIELAEKVIDEGYQVWLPWGSDEEKQRAERISTKTKAKVLEKMNLTDIAKTLAASQGVIGVDTGLCHLAAALDVPSVTIYGSTKPELTGTKGDNQHHMAVEFECAPCLKRQCQYQEVLEVTPACYTTVQPPEVWSNFKQKVGL